MPNISKEIRRQIKSFISQTTDEALDLVVNLTGKYIDEKQRIKLKREVEREEDTKIEETISKAYRLGLQLKEEYGTSNRSSQNRPPTSIHIR